MPYPCPDKLLYPAGPRPGTSKDLLGTILEMWGLVSTVISAVQYLIKPDLSHAIIARAIGPALVVVVVFAFFYKKCLESTQASHGCVAGIVHTVTLPFIGVADTIFPFTAMHPSFDVVVKCRHWPTLATNAGYIKYDVPYDPADPYRGSPTIRAYVFSSRVCAAGAGALAGAVVGGVVGVALGVSIEGALLSACFFLGPLCWLFAVIVAAAVAVVVTLAGAFVGGHYGQTFVAPNDESGRIPIDVGTYVTVRGKLIASGFDNGAIVFWFVDDSDPDRPGIANWGMERSLPPYDHSLATARFSSEDGQGGYIDLEDSFCGLE